LFKYLKRKERRRDGRGEKDKAKEVKKEEEVERDKGGLKHKKGEENGKALVIEGEERMEEKT
jgi:hypothetical protein